MIKSEGRVFSEYRELFLRRSLSQGISPEGEILKFAQKPLFFDLLNRIMESSSWVAAVSLFNGFSALRPSVFFWHI